MMTLAVMHAYQAAASAVAEAEYVKTLPESQRASYWASKAEQAAIARQERAVRALEELAHQGRHPTAAGSGLGFLFGLAIGSGLP